MPKQTKCISVIILNWLRPNNIKNLILPELTQSNLIGEIIICHCRADTKFSCYSNKVPIVHLDESVNNSKYGLSLRYYAARKAKYQIVIYIDDDIIVYPLTVVNMLHAYKVNSPCIVGRFGRLINRDLTYNEKPISGNHLSAPISLTSLVMVSRELCLKCISMCHPILDYVMNNSNPLWNGEDIFISLLSLVLYGKWSIITDNDIYFPVKKLRSPEDLSVAISKRKGHITYRSGLIKNISVHYKIHHDHLFKDPSNRRPKFN